MKRVALFASLLFGSLTTAANGEEYLLRLDSILSVNPTGSDEKPPDTTTVRSMEVIACPNMPFHAKVQSGEETFTFTGKLQPSENGGFTVTFRHAHVTEINKQERHISSLNTLLELSVGESVTAGELQGSKTVPSQPPHKVIIRHVMNLTPYQPRVK